MVPTPVAPLASDEQTRIDIERWLSVRGMYIAYGQRSAREYRGDLTLSLAGLIYEPTAKEKAAAKSAASGTDDHT